MLFMLAALAMPMAALGQQGAQGDQAAAMAKAIALTKDDPTSIPGACDSPMALDKMMSAIQQAVGNRIHDQLVDIRNPRTIFIKPTSFSCRVVTIWGQSKAMEGVFTQYVNSVGRVVYSWDGQKEISGTSR